MARNDMINFKVTTKEKEEIHELISELKATEAFGHVTAEILITTLKVASAVVIAGSAIHSINNIFRK